MSRLVHQALDALGYPGVVLLMVLENVFPPIPSELVMPYAGYAAAEGRMTLPGAILAGTLGSVLGALPLYALGRHLGQERLRRWADHHGHWALLTPADLDRADRWFDRHGGLAVFLCRLVPGVRSLISIPAGLYAMPLPRFLAWTAAGTALWAALLAWAGWHLGQRYEQVERWLGPVTWVVIGGLALWYVVMVWRRRRQRPAESTAGGD